MASSLAGSHDHAGCRCRPWHYLLALEHRRDLHGVNLGRADECTGSLAKLGFYEIAQRRGMEQ